MSVFVPIPKKGNAKECSNYHTIALISHGSKVMFKILQARLQQYVNCELPGVQPGFRKDRGNGDHIANILWIIEKAREFQKNISDQFRSDAQLGPTLCDPVDCSPPHSSVHGILQATILEWVAISLPSQMLWHSQ